MSNTQSKLSRRTAPCCFVDLLSRALDEGGHGREWREIILERWKD